MGYYVVKIKVIPRCGVRPFIIEGLCFTEKKRIKKSDISDLMIKAIADGLTGIRKDLNPNIATLSINKIKCDFSYNIDKLKK
jgi:hypothetical protein